MNTIDMRLTGTEEDLERWLLLLKRMDERGLIEILEQSAPYKNRGESKLYRVYIKVNLQI